MKIIRFLKEIKIAVDKINNDSSLIKIGNIGFDEDILGIKRDGKWRNFTITFQAKAEKPKNFNGNISEIKIYSKPLAKKEINKNYKASCQEIKKQKRKK